MIATTAVRRWSTLRGQSSLCFAGAVLRARIACKGTPVGQTCCNGQCWTQAAQHDTEQQQLASLCIHG